MQVRGFNGDTGWLRDAEKLHTAKCLVVWLPIGARQGKIHALSLLYLMWRRVPPFFGFNDLGY